MSRIYSIALNVPGSDPPVYEFLRAGDLWRQEHIAGIALYEKTEAYEILQRFCGKRNSDDCFVVNLETILDRYLA